MPRLYQNHKNVTPLPARPVQLGQIPSTAKLHSLKAASALLNEQFDGGFSPKQIQRWIENGDWQEGCHYLRIGKRYKIYRAAVQQWAITGARGG